MTLPPPCYPSVTRKPTTARLNASGDWVLSAWPPSRTSNRAPRMPAASALAADLFARSAEPVRTSVGAWTASHDLGGADPGLVGLLVGHLQLALPLRLDPAQVVVDLVGGAGLVPAQLAGHQPRPRGRPRRCRGRRSRSRSGCAGSARRRGAGRPRG